MTNTFNKYKSWPKSIWSVICVLGIFLSIGDAQYNQPSPAILVPNYGRCITPNRERALCVLLQDCPYLYNLLLTEPLSEQDKLYLSRSQCGYQSSNVLICCPDRHLKTSTQTTTEANNSNSQKRNQLLPEPGQCGNVLSNRIYGGVATKIDEFPWMALIEYTKSKGAKGHHCGGSLLNRRYVVTASHCVNGQSLPTDWRLTGVRLGEWDTTSNPDCEVDVRGEQDCAPEHVDVPVELAIPHPQYKPNSKNQENDIALLRLARNVDYNDFIQPICLPLRADLRTATFDGIAMDVAGWGKTEEYQSSAVKQKATVEGVELGDCQKVYSSQNIVLGEKQICAGGKQGVDSCRGDSGGPLVSTDGSSRLRNYYFLVGVVSFGPTPCGLKGWPGVYTRVGSFVDWIENTIQP